MNIFAYGTLICPEMVFALTGKNYVSEKAVLNNFKRFKIYDDGQPRAYPAIKKYAGGLVNGIILYDVDKESMEALDFFEGGEYIRTLLEIVTDGKKIKTYVYVWEKKYNPKLKNEWSLNYFIKNDMPEYVNEIIPDVLRAFNEQ